MSKALAVALAIFLGLLIPTAASAVVTPPIGRVDRTQGECLGAFTDEAALPLAFGSKVYRNQTITTGGDARIALTFEDGTQLTLGENASVKLDTFVYRKRGDSVVEASITGVFRYISGALGPGATRQTTITTPVAVIGARGTDFWGGPIDGAFGVLVLEGTVTVTTPAGTTVLSAPGQGTTVTAPGAAPGPVVTWPQDKVDRAVATITFQ